MAAMQSVRTHAWRPVFRLHDWGCAMIWYENLYIGDSIPRKEGKIRRIKWKIEHHAGQWNIYVIALCRYGTNLLEIIPARELLQKYYPRQSLYIVGLAKGYDEALETAARIIIDVYQHTGGFSVRHYIKKEIDKPQKAGDGA